MQKNSKYVIQTVLSSVRLFCTEQSLISSFWNFCLACYTKKKYNITYSENLSFSLKGTILNTKIKTIKNLFSNVSNDFEIKFWIFLISITLQWNRKRLFFSLVFHSFVTISNSLSLYNGDIFLVAELLTPNLCYRRFNEKVQIIGNLTTKLKINKRKYHCDHVSQF